MNYEGRVVKSSEDFHPRSLNSLRRGIDCAVASISATASFGVMQGLADSSMPLCVRRLEYRPFYPGAAKSFSARESFSFDLIWTQGAVFQEAICEQP